MECNQHMKVEGYIEKVKNVNRKHKESEVSKYKIPQRKTDEQMLAEFKGVPSTRFEDEVFNHHHEQKHSNLSGSSVMC